MKDNKYNRLNSFELGSINIDLTLPKVMGIINTTPDSFYEGSRNQSDKQLLTTVEKMLDEGADFLDIGGYSTRPNAPKVSVDEEIQRVIPAIELILKEFPKTIISVDTFRSKVAKQAIDAGALIINDVTGGNGDKNMFSTVANEAVIYILMHMKGTPKTMQNLIHYADIFEDIKLYFKQKIQKLNALNFNSIVLDIGYGFAKTTDQNFELLEQQDQFSVFGLPILTGISRKSMIYKSLNIKSEEALNGTTALNMIALERGSSILRVHDVKEAKETVELWKRLNGIK